MCLSSAAIALECGPLVSSEKLDQLQNAVANAGAVLNQHAGSLIQDMRGRLNAAQTEAALAQVDKMQLELNEIQQAESVGERVESALRIASVLAGVRDVMVDRRDTELANKFLSLYIAAAGRYAREANPFVNRILTKISIPGVAIDVAKLRDAIGMVGRELEKCESPKLPARVPQTRRE